MNKETICNQIDKNRLLIEKALKMNDIEMMYYIVRRLAKDNERLIAKLNECKQYDHIGKIPVYDEKDVFKNPDVKATYKDQR